MISPQNNHRGAWHFATLQFLSFASLSLLGTYGNVYFKRRGLSDIQLGILFAVPSAVSIFSPMIWGLTSDLLQRRKPIVITMHLVSAVLFPLFWFLSSQTFVLICIIMGLFSFFFRPSIPLIDTWTLDYLSNKGGDYGRIRSWGSVGYMVPLLLSILIFSSSSGGTAEVLLPMFFGVSGFRLLAAIQASYMPDMSPSGREKMDWKALKIYLHPFAIVFFFCVFVRSFVFSPFFAFFNVYLDTLGVTDNMKGLPWIVAVGAEVIMLAFSNKLIQRFGAVTAIICAYVAMAIRFFVLAAAPSWEIILVVQLLHAFTFGAYHLAAIQIINRITPEAFRATGQTLVSVIGGIGGILGNLIGGVWASSYGYVVLYRYLGLSVSVATIILVIAFSNCKE
ncbi:TPA: MFS transporter [Candidatus Poribacteria bacterium]|nr:MFS transporter [Candidatus Poribacteria bacterium]HIC03720.1 MFS transporter [Candidatus Poribacteria bacterium]HIO09417.1 MFS transporter [Candidatus Poribacteria bacterium]HIO49196.1 MFS transporter [Candidatus Poribacteria bacterium]